MYAILSLYIVCLVFSVFIESTKDNHTRNTLIFLCLLYLSFISGTSMVGGTDYQIYERIYSNCPTFPLILNPSYQSQNYEVGYQIINAFFKTLGISFYGFFLIHALFFYFCLWKGLKYFTNHFGLIIVIMLYKLFFYNTMISMRQSITVAVFFLMVPMIVEKKWIKYYILAYIASRVHNGAYLLFLIYPLRFITVTKQKILWLNIIFIPTIFIGFLGIDLMGPLGQFLHDNAANEAMASRTSGYFDNENLSPIGIFHTLEYFLVMFVVYKNIDRLNLKNDKVQIAFWMFLCLLPLFTLFRGSEILTREKDYFTIFYAVLLGYVIDAVPRLRNIIYLAVYSVCAFGYYRYVMLFDNGAFLRYQSWLFSYDRSFFLR